MKRVSSSGYSWDIKSGQSYSSKCSDEKETPKTQFTSWGSTNSIRRQSLKRKDFIGTRRPLRESKRKVSWQSNSSRQISWESNVSRKLSWQSNTSSHDWGTEGVEKTPAVPIPVQWEEQDDDEIQENSEIDPNTSQQSLELPTETNVLYTPNNFDVFRQSIQEDRVSMIETPRESDISTSFHIVADVNETNTIVSQRIKTHEELQRFKAMLKRAKNSYFIWTFLRLALFIIIAAIIIMSTTSTSLSPHMRLEIRIFSIFLPVYAFIAVSIFLLLDRRNKVTHNHVLFRICDIAAMVLMIGLFVYFVILVLILFEKDQNTAANAVPSILLIALIWLSGVEITLYWRLRCQSQRVLRWRRKKKINQPSRFSVEFDSKPEAELKRSLYQASYLGDVRFVASVIVELKARYGHHFLDQFTSSKMFMRLHAPRMYNPLHAACLGGHADIVEMLLGHRLPVNAFDRLDCISNLMHPDDEDDLDGPKKKSKSKLSEFSGHVLFSPLHIAVACSHTDIVKILLNHGASPELFCQASYFSAALNCPPLFWSSKPEICGLLIGNGANMLTCLRNRSGLYTTILQQAYWCGNRQLVEYFESSGADIALSFLHNAVARNDRDQVRKLLDHGTDSDALAQIGVYGRTPLHWAAMNGQFVIAELLLERGATVDYTDVLGRTPLHWAARHNHARVVQLLIALGADASLEDKQRYTPICVAAEAENIAQVILGDLVAMGANINHEIENGDTALHIALKNENWNTGLALIRSGADIMKVNQQGQRLVDCSLSTDLMFEVGKEASIREVMISYPHTHAAFAEMMRDKVRANNMTIWMDSMNQSGIRGGSIWRNELAKGILNASVLLCVVNASYADSAWCMKELAFARHAGIPVVAVSDELYLPTGDLEELLDGSEVLVYQSSYIGANPPLRTMMQTLHNNIDEYQMRRNLIQVAAKGDTKMSLDSVAAEVADRSASQASKIEHNSRKNTRIVFIIHSKADARYAQRLYEYLSFESCLETEFVLDSTSSAREACRRSRNLFRKSQIVLVVHSAGKIRSMNVLRKVKEAKDLNKEVIWVKYLNPFMSPGTCYTLVRTRLSFFVSKSHFKANFWQLMEVLRDVLGKETARLLRRKTLRMLSINQYKQKSMTSLSVAPVKEPMAARAKSKLSDFNDDWGTTFSATRSIPENEMMPNFNSHRKLTMGAISELNEEQSNNQSSNSIDIWEIPDSISRNFSNDSSIPGDESVRSFDSDIDVTEKDCPETSILLEELVQSDAAESSDQGSSFSGGSSDTDSVRSFDSGLDIDPKSDYHIDHEYLTEFN